MGATVVENVIAGVIISESLAKSNEESAKRFAEDPELTAIPNFFPNRLATFISNSFTFGPDASQPFSNDSNTAFFSSSPKTAFAYRTLRSIISAEFTILLFLFRLFTILLALYHLN